MIGRETVAGDRNDDLIEAIEAIEDVADRELDRFGTKGVRKASLGPSSRAVNSIPAKPTTPQWTSAPT